MVKENEKRILLYAKPELAGYMVLLAVFSIPTVILPIWLGYEKYVTSDIWIAHIFVTLQMLFWSFYLYRELIVYDDKFIIRWVGLFGMRQEIVVLSELTSWQNGNPIFLNTKTQQYQIRWGVLSRVHCVFIRQKIASLPIKEIKA